MPIHSLGIEALSGLDHTVSVGFRRGGYLVSAFHYSERKQAALTALLQLKYNNIIVICKTGYKQMNRNKLTMSESSIFTEIYISATEKH